ncbi:MAG: FtsW/RodA/SpoVE family cell cycle protein [Saprospiraceae bacterium]|jgi:cell division protein FtsW|nr:FtsW/RodA/SpoVE family cell cycle protein [Saprospiraceae bacterium]MDP5049093.1 FtsW/RodA/SpoVE family cell cycle protein [Saprospiraceae bacterium]MDP5090982.1 FtsW/RodA/SpoVE family cell cycle protein [Saprospiraceae bacterium]
MTGFIANLKTELKGDRVIWVLISLMTLVSLLGVYSSTGSLAHKEQGGNTEYYVIKQGFIVLFGFFIMYVLHRLHYLRFHRVAPFLFIVAIPLLIFTLFFGVDINSARRWIEIPVFGFTFQSSDFARLALILYLARTISSKQSIIKDFKSAFLPLILPVIIICFLIAPADLSTALLLFSTCIAMMFVGRVAVKYILMLVVLAIIAFSILILLGHFFPDLVRLATWIERIREFTTDSDGGFQVQQSKVAIANGGFFGTGPGQSIQRNFLPSSYADFIYAILVEEYGLLGGFFVISLYLGFFFRITRLVTKSTKAFGAIVVTGLGFSFVFQAFINIAVATHLVPVTGVTLPMISLGGTSIIMNCISLGIILSVSKFVESSNISTDVATNQ